MPRHALPSAALATTLAALLAAALAGCAFEPHVPRPLDAAQVQRDWLATQVDGADPSLKAALQQAGVDVTTWPLSAWGLPALTVLALRRHPDLAVARAEANEALAARDAAGRRADPGLELALEHHSAPGAASSPWSLGVALDGLVGGGERRAALRDQADALADEALLRAALAAWQVRQQVRDAWQGLALAQQRLRLADDLAALRADALRLADRRLAHGAGDASTLDTARHQAVQATMDRAAAQAAVAQARLSLARALALSPAQLDALALALPMGDAPPPPATDDLALQRRLLLDRLPLRAQLARYAAADAALRVEVARQWPELSLKPGLMWDQGDLRWSLGLGLVLPLVDRNRGAIAQANARRETEAARFTALQADALHELDAARLAAGSAARQLALADTQARTQAAAQARTARRLQAGDADRGDWLAAREAALQSERALVDARADWAVAQARLEDVVQHPLDDRASAAPVLVGRIDPH